MTPIVYVIVTKLRLNPLPYVFACAFIANTASLLLPVSNPVNLLPVDSFGITLGEYLKLLFIPALLSIAVNILLFIFIFRKHAYSSFKSETVSASICIDKFFIIVCIGLAFTALGYIFSSLYGLPLSLPALGGAIILLITGFGFRRLSIGNINYGISWSIFPFIFCIAVVIRGLQNTGVTHTIGEMLAYLSSKGELKAIFSASFGTAIGSNLINNWPMMMVSVSSLESISNPAPFFDHRLIYASIIGADLGPNITILGSLSSMLWLLLLRKRGLDIHPLQYLKLGLIVTPILLIISTLSLYACSLFWK